MSKIHLRKYGVEATVDFDLFEIDGVDFRTDAAHAAGDTKVMKDEGAEANTTNAFTDEGQGYSIVLPIAEMQAARIVIYVVDQTATKAWLDRTITIETYGHASAQHAVDLDDAVRGGMTALPNAAADAAGGLPISAGGSLALDTQLANTNEITAARMGALTDWINGGRLDLILDIIAVDVAGIDGDAMRGTDSASTHSAADVLSAIQAAGTHLTLIKAVTDVLPDAGALTTIGTDTARLTAVRAAVLTDWINGGRLDLLLDAVKVITDALTSAGAGKLAKGGLTMIAGTVAATAGSPTVIYSDDITDATADFYNGRNLYPTSGALLGQGTDITDYEQVGGEGKFTVTAMTAALADNVTFIII